MALPIRRRIGPTPSVYHSREDAWDFSLSNSVYEAMNPKDRPIPAIKGSSSKDEDGKPTTGALPEAKKKPGIMDLPIETQKQIFSFSSQMDLIALSLVSNHMRDIAASHLYRKFHIVVPDDEDPLNERHIDSLACGLETFVASEYNYAQYLRSIILNSLSSGPKGEQSYRYLLYDTTSGKLLNTLLLLTVRKARALETFKWDLRIELSREVFKALHKSEALQHFHLRMHYGETQFVVPPPLPDSTDILTSIPVPAATAPLQNGVIVIPAPGYPTDFTVLNTVKTKHKKLSDSSQKDKTKPPPTISGFKKLKTLAVLDIESHDYMDEIQGCLRNSSSTLSTLKLSFSPEFAGKAKKPPPELHSDDESDIEDEFGQLIPPPPAAGASDPNGPTKALKALEESKKQEAAIGKIFGIDNATSKAKEADPETPPNEPEADDTDLSTQPIKKLVSFYGKFMSQVKPGGENTPEGKEALEMIEQATKKFLDVCDKATPIAIVNEDSTAGEPAPSTGADKVEAGVTISGEDTTNDGPGLFDEPGKKKEPVLKSGVSNPDDIDVEQPDVEDLVVDNSVESSSTDTPDQESSTTEEAVDERDLSLPGSPAPEKSINNMEPESESLAKLQAEIEEVQNRMKALKTSEDPEDSLTRDSAMSDYVRKTRGLTLETLGFYAVPIRASVLAKAIDFSVLRNITLLSVGSQTNLWVHLEKENKQKALAIRKIHTDGVTLPFLNLVSQLEHLEELYLLERLPKRGDTTAVKTAVTMEQIRKAVLKKHVSSLKVLMLRNDTSHDWDLNIKSVMLLCQRATKLEELTATFVSKSFHTLLQFFSGLTALRAIHILLFRHQDNCDFTRVELPRLIIDIVSNNPGLKLEYLACIDIVERLVRRKLVKTKTRTAAEKKQTSLKSLKAIQSNWGITEDMLDGNMANNVAALDAGIIAPYDWQDSSDDEVENMYGKNGLKVETLILRPCDVQGVRIFANEILTGRL